MTGTDKVSIIIPTRRRPDTLAKAVLTAVNQTHRNIEVIVSNNGNTAETRAVVQAIGDPRVRCVEPPRPLSMSHNFEFGMDHATGDWLVLIGDDDGILPSGVERALKMLREAGAEALGSATCVYRWPIDGASQRGPFLSVPLGSGWKWQRSERQMRRILTRDVGFNEAPMTYSGGVVRTALYNRVKAVRGTFYQSQIPDCFSAFAFLSTVDRYVFSREALMVAGVSSHSHGSTGLSLKANPFNQDANIPFHQDLILPEEGTFTFSFQAMLYESYLQTTYLRTAKPITRIEEQVVAIVAYAGWYRNRIAGGDRAHEAALRWARRAAEHYGLNHDSILAQAKRLSLRQASSQYRQRIRDFLSRYVVDDRLHLPISDVYQASIAAETIMRSRPNRLQSFGRTAMRKLRQ